MWVAGSQSLELSPLPPGVCFSGKLGVPNSGTPLWDADIIMASLNACYHLFEINYLSQVSRTWPVGMFEEVIIWPTTGSKEELILSGKEVKRRKAMNAVMGQHRAPASLRLATSLDCFNCSTGNGSNRQNQGGLGGYHCLVYTQNQ